MNYQEITKEQSQKIMQPIYQYMPIFTAINGKMVRVVAVENGTTFYTSLT